MRERSQSHEPGASPSSGRPWPDSVAERQEVRTAIALGVPLVTLRDPRGTLILAPLPADAGPVVIGRADGLDIRIDWDRRVSRVHARIEVVGPDRVIDDASLSRNGTWVNGTRVSRRILAAGDVIRVGVTSLAYHAPPETPDDLTEPDWWLSTIPNPSPGQRRVLSALCELASSTGGLPPSNEALAERLTLSVDAVKAHLRALYRHFAIDEIAPGQKRVRLIQLGAELGFGPMSDHR